MRKKDFDPNASGTADGIFGLPFSYEESQLILLPVPFEATTSYGGGTSEGPENLLQASRQVDLYHPVFPRAWENGIYFLPLQNEVKTWNENAKKLAAAVRENKGAADEVNKISQELNTLVAKEAERVLKADKILGVVGGDHSVPFGAIQKTLEKYPKMGVLHIDAHHDLRNAYEGFEHSHASIFYNVMTKTDLKHLVQVGIRDYCEEEKNFAQKHDDRIHVFYDDEIFAQKSNGTNWKEICREIVGVLPAEVYISFDIDGLDPTSCPGTGTPVPGGLSFQEAVFLLREIYKTGRRIVGFDLCEVGSNEFDGNVGARMLYELCVLSLVAVK